jgi:uncharacterized protein (DUF1810 family)
MEKSELALKLMRENDLDLEVFIKAYIGAQELRGSDYYEAARHVFNTVAGVGLDRFKLASAGMHLFAKADIAAGKKSMCYMWFMYPQIRGLGKSRISRFYGIKGMKEAKEYLLDDELREALVDLLSYMLRTFTNKDISKQLLDMFGFVDCMKLRSCITLFDKAYQSLKRDNSPGWGIEGADVFNKAINQFFGGLYCSATTNKLLNPK